MKFFLSFFVILSLLFFYLPAQAAGSWTEKDLGTVQGLRGFTEVGSSLFAVGNTGNIIRSIDSGETWSSYDQSTSVYWQDIESQDSMVWAIGESGILRQSSDSGTTWSSVGLGITQTLYDLDASSSRGYMVGASGRILVYNATANLWLTVSSPVSLDLYRTQDRGDATGWIVGAEGILLYTYDSGNSWTNKGKVGSENLYGVWFTSSTTGYVVGRNGTFKKTTDGGASWSSISVSGLSTQTLYDIRADGDQIVVAGDDVILLSEDAGENWDLYDYSDENYTLRNAYFGEDGIWVVGTQNDTKSVILLFEEEEEVVVEEATDETVVEEETTADETVELVEAEPGTLIKLPCIGETETNDSCRAVYFYATDGYRHAFPNEKIFFTWFDDFEDVVDVSADFMSDIPLGSNVTYHPGTRMVKFQSVPTVYGVSAGGVLRAIASEEVAEALYGEDWNQQVDDIPDAFFGNYTFGEKINGTQDYDREDEMEQHQDLDDNF